MPQNKVEADVVFAVERNIAISISYFGNESLHAGNVVHNWDIILI